MAERPVAVVIGAGPAGLGPLVSAMQRGAHGPLLDRGVVWVEAGSRVGRGAVGDYAIASDTSASVLLECLGGGPRNPLSALSGSAEAARVRGYGTGPLPLATAADFLEAVGRVCSDVVAAHPASALLLGTRAVSLQVPDRRGGLARGGVRVRLNDGTQICADTAVQALGGHQDWARVLTQEVAHGIRLNDGYAPSAFATTALVAPGGVEQLTERLTAYAHPRVVVIGSSHSAVTTVDLLLSSPIPFGEGAITLLCRRLPTISYPDAASAVTDGYHAFGPRDICPVTGRVHRLSGLRMAGRDLLRRVWRLGGSAPEPRVRIALLPETGEPALRGLLDGASVIVPAFGYRPRTLPVHDESGRRVPLLAGTGARAPLVDHRCRVLRADGSPVAGLLGAGLASGFIPSGRRMGGEPSFRGQTNGIWLYQNGVGQLILEQLRPVRGSKAPRATPRAPRATPDHRQGGDRAARRTAVKG